MDIDGETEATRQLYGLDADYRADAYLRPAVPARPPAGRARRAVRRADLPRSRRHDRWDQHSNLVKNGTQTTPAPSTSRSPALLKDLKQRGLLDETLVVWAGEFGRTPFAQGTDGRDHNPFGFSLWLAGGGVKGRHDLRRDRRVRLQGRREPLEIHDLHATMLHLLGIDHTRLTFRFGGRDMR